jgi:hypothetical protein
MEGISTTDGEGKESSFYIPVQTRKIHGIG